jgi:hypothetical protein
MLESSEVSKIMGFVTSIVFSAAVIFGCSFGIVGIFKTLSTYDLDDLMDMSNQDADSIVASITGISIDEESLEGQLVGQVKDVVYGFEDKEEYSFQDATNDAKNMLTNVFDDFDADSTTDVFNDVVASVSDFVDGDSKGKGDTY